MNKIILATLLIVVSVATQAAPTTKTKKVCFGSTSGDTKGAVLAIEVDAQNISINTIRQNSYFSGDFYHNETYPAYNSSSKGKDGKTYLHYKGELSDYQDVIMVDSELLKLGTTGLLQIRARGEGFFNNVFVCRDDKARK